MSAKPIRKPYVQPANNDPGIGQGRNEHHVPLATWREALFLLAVCCLAPLIGVGIAVLWRAFA